MCHLLPQRMQLKTKIAKPKICLTSKTVCSLRGRYSIASYIKAKNLKLTGYLSLKIKNQEPVRHPVENRVHICIVLFKSKWR